MSYLSLTSSKYRKKSAKRYILTLIQNEGEISQSKIVQETKIRPGTVQEIIQELLEENLIRVKGVGVSRGGRKPVLIEINPDSKWTVGLDIDEERIAGGVVNLKGEILREIEITGCNFRNQQALIDTISKSIEGLVGNNSVKKSIYGAGIGIPGLVDKKNGIGISCSYYDWWRNIPLKSLLENRLNFPFEIVNDTIAATLGEKWFGIGKGINNFLYIDIGETVGMGIVINGQLYYGTGGNAGELGHTIIQKDGPLCICGNEGCVEALASGMALKREAERLRKKGVRSLIFDHISNKNVTLERIIDALSQRDKVAHKLIYDMGTYLGIAISNIVNILNPELVILGGSLMQVKDFFTEIISQSIKTNCLPKLALEVKVGSSNLGTKSGILGASTLITKEIFDFY
jgi:predicted NBD/HSP70 family sugar kinase